MKYITLLSGTIMRTSLLLVFIISILNNVHSQNEIALDDDGQLQVLDTIDLAGSYDQRRLYSNVSAFLAKDFLNRINKRKFSDRDEGLIICMGTWYHTNGKRRIFYDVEFTISDKRIIIKLDNIRYWNGGYSRTKYLNDLMKEVVLSPSFNKREKLDRILIQVNKIRDFFISGITGRIEED